MQATSLTFVIVATQIGTATGQISQTTAAALLAAGLLSAALFPAAALKLLTVRTPGTHLVPGQAPSRAGLAVGVRTARIGRQSQQDREFPAVRSNNSSGSPNVRHA